MLKDPTATDRVTQPLIYQESNMKAFQGLELRTVSYQLLIFLADPRKQEILKQRGHIPIWQGNWAGRSKKL